VKHRIVLQIARFAHEQRFDALRQGRLARRWLADFRQHRRFVDNRIARRRRRAGGFDGRFFRIAGIARGIGLRVRVP